MISKADFKYSKLPLREVSMNRVIDFRFVVRAVSE